MKTITKFLLLAVLMASVSCGEAAPNIKMAVPGTLADSGNMEDLISFGSITDKMFYVSKEQQEYAIARLNGEMLDSVTLAFVFNGQKVNFGIAPMDKLDFDRDLKAGDFGTWDNMVCHPYTTVGACLDMVDETTGNFLFSMKVPKGGFSYCVAHKKEKCDWIWVLYKEATWTKSGCKGNSAGNQMVRVCYDNNS